MLAMHYIVAGKDSYIWRCVLKQGEMYCFLSWKWLNKISVGRCTTVEKNRTMQLFIQRHSQVTTAFPKDSITAQACKQAEV